MKNEIVLVTNAIIVNSVCQWLDLYYMYLLCIFLPKKVMFKTGTVAMDTQNF